MPKRGFFFDLTNSIENNANVHRELVARIEQLTGRNLICYIANPGHPVAAIQDHDPDLLENLLRSTDRLDVTAVFESMKAIQSTQAIAKDLLKDGLLRNDHSKIDQVVTALMSEGEKELHGKHLYPSVLREQIGLPVTVLLGGSELDVQLRELFVRMEIYATNKGVAKYLVTREGGLDVNVQIRQVPVKG